MRDDVRDRIDAHTLLRQLESSKQETYLDSLRYKATLDYVGELLEGLQGHASGIYSTEALFDRLDDARSSFVAVEKPRVKLERRAQKPDKPAVPVIEPKPFQDVIPVPVPGDTSVDDVQAHDQTIIDHGEPDHLLRSEPPSSPTPATDKATPTETPPPPPPRAKRPAPIPVSQLKQRKQPSFSSAAATGPGTASSSALMEHHASLQNSLLSSLTSMSSQLKFNTVSFSQSLAEDRDVMESAKQKLEVNYDRMKKEGGRLDTFRKKNRGTTCALIGIVAAVAVAWVVMLGLIKVT